MTALFETLFTSLKGDWVITRSIPFHGKFKGRAHFKYISSTLLHYQEEGLLRITQKTCYQATREYFYCYRDYSNAPIAVYFVNNNAPGELLHALTRQSPSSSFPFKANALHHCLHDTYSATYEFIHDKKFYIDYHIDGPHKKYVINTCYQRA